MRLVYSVNTLIHFFSGFYIPKINTFNLISTPDTMYTKSLLSAIFILVCAQLFSQIPTASLVGYYPFTGNANDLSGNSLHGTVSGATLTTDRFGNANSAYIFDGSNDVISLPAGSYTTLNVYTYSFWYKQNAAQAGIPICFGESSYGYCQAVTVQTNGAIFAGAYNNGSNPLQSYISSPGMSNQQWVHVVMTRDFSQVALYVNGSQISYTSTANTNNQNASYGTNTPIKAYIGARTLNTLYFNGVIDDVRIYGTALTQTAVTELYNETCFAPLPTVSYSACPGNTVGLTAAPSGSNTVSWFSTATGTSAIASGSFFATPTLSVPGSYTYYVAASNCSAYARPMITVNVSPNPTLSVNSGTICSGNSFVISPSGAASYSFSGGSSVVSPNTSTSYTITGSSAQGCAAVNTVVSTVIVNATPTITINSGFVCQGNSFTLAPSGALSYTYPGGSPVVTPAANSVYTVTGSNNNGCVSTAVANVGVVANPVITISGPSQICVGESATLTASGGNIYTWNIGSANAIITVTPSTSTSYSVTGVNIFGCVAGASKLITVNPLPVISVNSGSVCSGKIFTMSPSGATTYSFSNGSSTVIPTVNSTYTVTGYSGAGCASSPVISSVTIVNSPVVSVNSGTVCANTSFTMSPSGALSYTYSGGSAVVTPVSTTSYTVTGVNAAGCTATAISNVVVNQLPVVTISSPAGACLGSSVTLTAGGATTYTWNTGAQTNAISVAPAANTTYSVSGTDNNNCINSISKTITAYTLPVISANSGSICSGSSFTIVPSGAVTYTYSGGSNIVSPVTTTSYSVTGTSSQGCVSANAGVSTVNIVASPVVAVSGGSICAGNSFTFTPSGASTYTYSGGSPIVTPLTNTTYTITGANGAGCTGSAVATVTVSPLPTLTFTNPGAVCLGNFVNLSVSGAQNYVWSTGATSSTISVSPAVTSIYTVTGTNALGCARTTTTQVNVNPLPVISASSGTICSGKSFNIIVSGASTYTYSGGSSVVTPTSSTSYSVYGTSALGCVSSNPGISNVSVLPLPAVTVNSGTICAGSSFTLSPSGATSYTYSGGSAVVSPLSNTSYTVTGASGNGCTNIAVATITVFSLPNIVVNNSGPVCNGNAANLSASGATSFLWSTGANTASIAVTPSVTTVYTVTGNSAVGCAMTVTTTVVVNTLPVISVNSGSICAGKSFTIIPSGASSYTYSGGSNVVSPLSNSSYSVTGTSSQGCVSSNTAISSVTVVALPVVTVTSGSMCAGSSFVLVPSGAGSYTFSSGSATVSPAVSSIYTVTGTSGQGCVSAPATSTVTVHSLPSVSVNSGAICAGGQFTIVPSGAVSYTISGGSAVVSPTSTTTYSVLGTSTAGCISSSFAISNVTVNPIPVITVGSGTVCQGGSFTLVPAGASGYTFSSGSNIVTPSVTTSYSVTGTSSAGCAASNTAVATVSVYSLPSLSISAQASVCSGYTTTMTASGATTYSWSNGATGSAITITPQANTAFTVTGYSGQGCISSGTVAIFVNPLPTVTINSGAICPGNTFTLAPAGALTYTYSSGSNIVNPITTTSYSIYGTDIAGCTSSVPAVATVSVVNTLTVTISGSPTVCAGSPLVLTANGASTYSWSNGSQLNSIVVSPAGNTTYSVMGSSGTCSDNATFSVQVAPTPTVTLNSGAICLYETFTLNASGAQTYTFSNGLVSSGTVPVSPNSTTTFTIKGTSVDGCVSDIAVTTITVHPLPNIIVATSNNIACVGDQITLTAVGGDTYQWDNGFQGSPYTLIANTTQQFTVTGTDNNNCKGTAMIAVAVEACVGIEKTVSEELSIFPNPNTGNFFVTNLGISETFVRITDLQGKVLIEKKMSPLEKTVEVNTGLKPGLYFISVVINNRVTQQQKMIITN